MNHRITSKDLEPDLFGVSHIRGFLDVSVVWACVTMVFAAVGSSGDEAPYRVWIWVVGAIVVGVLQNNLSSLAHHAVHWHLHPEKPVNDHLFRWAIAAPMGHSFHTLRREHMAHHAKLGEPEDPERHYYDLDHGGVDSPRKMLLYTFAMFSGYVIVGHLRRVFFGARAQEAAEMPGAERLAKERREMAFVLPAQFVVFAVAFALTGAWYAYFVLWLLPLVTVGAGLNAFRATIEHADPSMPKNLYRTFLSNPFERFVVAPFNFSYHYEHHRFMNVPYYRMRRVRQVLSHAGDLAECSIERSYLRRFMSLLGEFPRTRDASTPNPSGN